MPTIPTSVTTWDSTLTHIVSITSGHASSGFVNDESPGSGEINCVLNLNGQWCQFVSDSIAATVEVGINILNASPFAASGTPSHTTLGVLYWTNGADGWGLMAPLFLPVGSTITDVLIGYRHAGSTNPLLGSLISTTLAGAQTILASNTDSSGGSSTDKTMSFATGGASPALPAVVTTETNLHLLLNGQASDRFYGATIKYTRAAL